MWLNEKRNYKIITQEEKQAYEEIHASEKVRRFGNINRYNDYPEAVKHYLSLFPNNHIYLCDMKKNQDLHALNVRFYDLYYDIETNEQDILRFINHDPQAYHIIGSIFNAGGFRFGHHDAYLFPEFRLGNEYRADYLLIGKSSGGYEFIFVELEKPNGRVTLQNGHPGQVIRSGEFQIEDWKSWVDAHFNELKTFFDKEKQVGKTLPTEFYQYDRTRVHYVVVGGTREDYTDTTYQTRRRREQEANILILHYDNLFDAAERLLDCNTF